MANNFKKELRTIQKIVKGSHWAKEPDTVAVLDEYDRVISAESEKNILKRASLQILYSSRAIDTLLAIIVKRDFANRRQAPSDPYFTIGSSLNHLKNQGLVSGKKLNVSTYNDLDDKVLSKRNRYLHKAGIFPSLLELRQFITATLNGIRVISKM
jgi:hypothetical protein